MLSKKNDDNQQAPSTESYCSVCTFDDTSDVVLLIHRNYKAAVTVDLSSREMRTINRVLHTGDGPNLIGENDLCDKWLPAVKSEQKPQLQSVTYQKLPMVGKITVHVRVGGARVRVDFGAVRQMAVPVLLESSFIDKYDREIVPDKRKIVPHNSESIPILAVLKEVETEEERAIKVARMITLAPPSETPVPVGTSPSGIVEVSRI